MCLFLAVILVSACTSKEIVLDTVPVAVPDHVKSCPIIDRKRDIPDPSDPNVTQLDVAVSFAEIVGIADDCRIKLDSVVDIIDDFNENEKSPR